MSILESIFKKLSFDRKHVDGRAKRKNKHLRLIWQIKTEPGETL